ncbi:MAG: hypothetical protein ACFFG0_47090 [Candidatus Thorarchaeota archaeon]
MLSQLHLRSKIINALDGTTKIRYLFPFFDKNLNISFFMMELKSHRLVFINDIPQQIKGRVIEFAGNLRFNQNIFNFNKRCFFNSKHFDPWWILKDRDDIAIDVKKMIMRTNIAHKQIRRQMVRDVIFTDDLLAVEGFLIGDGVFKGKFISKQELFSGECEWL